ncbi:hypothetical protein [Rhizobium mongolense]|uniref:hypothetical protein n=1 Tax=Rhizobium mongolense TaxID=57676 RepID=UPI0034A3D9ED
MELPDAPRSAIFMIERNNFKCRNSLGIRNLGLRTSSVIVFLALVAHGEHRHDLIALYLERDEVVAAERMERPVPSEMNYHRPLCGSRREIPRAVLLAVG